MPQVWGNCPEYEGLEEKRKQGHKAVERLQAGARRTDSLMA